MASNWKLKMAMIHIAFVSCSQSQVTGTIGNKLISKTSLYSNYGVQPSYTFVYDEPTDRILKIDLANLKIENSYSVSSETEDHTVVAPASGAYVIDFSKKHMEIVKTNGSRLQKPFSFQGTPVSAAFNSSKGIFVMQDDLQSIGLIKFSEIGDITGSWLGGSLVGSGKAILAGDIDQNGKLVLAVSDKSILIVDIAATISQKSWSYSTYSSELESVSWVAPDSEYPSRSLLIHKSGIASFDSTSGTFPDQKKLSDLNSVIVGQSKAAKPHVILENSSTGKRSLYYINRQGVLSSLELPDILIRKSADSFLSAEASTLTVNDTSNSKVQRILQVRLSDNLVTLEKSLETSGEILVNDSMAFINRKSDLGYLQTFRFSDSELKELSSYNLEIFREE